jgi:hypothetical protein
VNSSHRTECVRHDAFEALLSVNRVYEALKCHDNSYSGSLAQDRPDQSRFMTRCGAQQSRGANILRFDADLRPNPLYVPDGEA